MKPTPFEYYEGKLGVKISFLICDRDFHMDSLKVIAYNTLYYRTKRKSSPEQFLRRASLNNDALVLFSSLCQEWRDRLTVKFGSPKQEVKKSWFAQHYEADKKAFDFYMAHRYGEENRKLDTSLIERYTYNASVLNTVIRVKANRKAYCRTLGCTKVDIWDSLSKDVNAFRDVEHTLPTTKRGLQMKVKAYQEQGYIALISGKLTNQNAAKVKEDTQTALLDELLAKHTNLDNTQVANIYNSVAGIQDWKTITPQTVANRKQENNLVIYAGRNGKAKLLDHKLMQVKRKAPSKPMLYWTMDGWDAELLYQKATINAQGNTVTTYHNRLTAVMVLDPYNKYIVGYAIGERESPALIKEALRNAMQHTKELFGDYYRPYQLQTDRYQIKHLTPTYEACTVHYTPANVNSKKTKVIEPFFNRFNKEYCQLFDNWSGHNVDSGSKNQPNDEVLNKIRKSFPDENGCRQQLIGSIEADRAKKVAAFVEKWQEVAEEHKSIMSFETYLQYLGEKTGYTNKLSPSGLLPTINGIERCFDSFDINFRKLFHIDWCVMYDPADLSKVLVMDAESKSGKFVKLLGNYSFVLDEIYIQPMALADRVEGDAAEKQRITDYNDNVMKYITNERADNADVLHEFLSKPQLQDTLAKHLLVDSLGHHKDHNNSHKINKKAQKVLEVQEARTEKAEASDWRTQQNDYHKQRINLNDYI
ncbi:hypothetical protein GCM10007424_23370 [Flavobacterium suaedae]|uniref:Integrase catalytic domain-containing protein n=1 Tax=Flavobacterium suaedae TaxID=1767027 RepID=A0ABQ1K0S5_9FLAO|nr:hypothetical protein [Flavobacterium suaedae]GGB82662.1 hypothetical protein GCM10007424_23370 [Flavobacterium suaedae]